MGAALQEELLFRPFPQEFQPAVQDDVVKIWNDNESVSIVDKEKL